jgi:hypothetical protein
MMENAGLALLAQTVVGWMWQWARGPKRLPNWASWAVFGGVAVACFWWATPDALPSFASDWRKAIFMLVSFVLAARGAAATAKEAGVAPKTNSL